MNKAQREILQNRYNKILNEQKKWWVIPLCLIAGWFFGNLVITPILWGRFYGLDIIDFLVPVAIGIYVSWKYNDNNKKHEELEFQLARPLTKKEKDCFNKVVLPEIHRDLDKQESKKKKLEAKK